MASLGGGIVIPFIIQDSTRKVKGFGGKRIKKPRFREEVGYADHVPAEGAERAIPAVGEEILLGRGMGDFLEMGGDLRFISLLPINRK